MSSKLSSKIIKKKSKEINQYLFCKNCNSFIKKNETESHCNLNNPDLSEIKEIDNKDNQSKHNLDDISLSLTIKSSGRELSLREDNEVKKKLEEIRKRINQKKEIIKERNKNEEDDIYNTSNVEGYTDDDDLLNSSNTAKDENNQEENKSIQKVRKSVIKYDLNMNFKETTIIKVIYFIYKINSDININHIEVEIKREYLEDNKLKEDILYMIYYENDKVSIQKDNNINNENELNNDNDNYTYLSKKVFFYSKFTLESFPLISNEYENESMIDKLYIFNKDFNNKKNLILKFKFDELYELPYLPYVLYKFEFIIKEDEIFVGASSNGISEFNLNSPNDKGISYNTTIDQSYKKISDNI